MARNLKTGKKGESLAAAYMEERGYRILEKNYRSGRLEVDLIAIKKDTLHFIEVKTRTSTLFGYPEENVSNMKIERILEAAEAYMNENQYYKRLQLDILSILIREDGETEYFLIEDVYL